MGIACRNVNVTRGADSNWLWMTLVQKVLQKILMASSVDACLEILESHYGFDYSTFHFLSNVKAGCDNPFVRTTYPEKWVSQYLLNNYAAIDPIVMHSVNSREPFDWSEIKPEPKSMVVLEKAAEFGLGSNGFTCPYLDTLGRASILSVNSKMPDDEWAALMADKSEELIFISQDLHIKALSEVYTDGVKPPLLSPREYECLQWTAAGKTYSEISIILGLSEHTVRSYLKVARLKLDSVSLAQAVAKAGNMGLI